MGMIQERAEIMQKARAKRCRHEEAKPATIAAPRMRTASTHAESLTEKVIDLAQGAAAQVGAFVKTAAHSLAGAGASMPQQPELACRNNRSSTEVRSPSRLLASGARA
jgi:hypothetical protein